MTEFEIIHLVEQRIKEIKPESYILAKINKKSKSTILSLLKIFTQLGLRFVMQPQAFTKDGEQHPAGVPVRVDTNEEILSVLKARREELNLETHQVDIMLNLCSGYCSNVESGKNRLSLNYLLRFCNLLWIDLSVETDPDVGPYASDLFIP